MTDHAETLLNAIEDGEQDKMDAAFYDAINAKIADAIEAKKIEIASQLYGQEDIDYSDDEVESIDNSSETETVTSENGIEEI